MIVKHSNSNEIKEKYLDSRQKDLQDQSKGKTKKLVVMVARGELLLSVVLHIVYKFYGGEYDPLYVERIKQTLFLMFDEKLLELLEHNYNSVSLSTPYHFSAFANKAPPMHLRIPKRPSTRKNQYPSSSRGKFHDEAKDHFMHFDSSEEHKIVGDNFRNSLIRGSDLMSHEVKDQRFEHSSVKKPPSRRLYDSSSNLDQFSNLEDSKMNMSNSIKAPLDISSGKRSSSVGPRSQNVNASADNIKSSKQEVSIMQ